MDNTGRELLRVLERQRDVFQRLRELAERQRAWAARDDPKSLLVLLAERQRLVGDLSQCNAAMDPFRRNWATTLMRLTSEQRLRVDELLVESDRVLGSGLSPDDRDAAMFANRQGLTAGKALRPIDTARTGGASWSESGIAAALSDAST